MVWRILKCIVVLTCIHTIKNISWLDHLLSSNCKIALKLVYWLKNRFKNIKMLHYHRKHTRIHVFFSFLNNSSIPRTEWKVDYKILSLHTKNKFSKTSKICIMYQPSSEKWHTHSSCTNFYKRNCLENYAGHYSIQIFSMNRSKYKYN